MTIFVICINIDNYGCPLTVWNLNFIHFETLENNDTGTFGHVLELNIKNHLPAKRSSLSSSLLSSLISISAILLVCI